MFEFDACIFADSLSGSLHIARHPTAEPAFKSYGPSVLGSRDEGVSGDEGPRYAGANKRRGRPLALGLSVHYEFHHAIAASPMKRVSAVIGIVPSPVPRTKSLVLTGVSP